MESETRYDPIWRQYADFKFTEEEDRCVFAREFGKWAKELCRKATQEPSLVPINQSYILLLNKYFEWRAVVPKSHRNRVGTVGHVCIFQIFQEAFHTLKAVELALTPPLLFVPPEPKPAESPSIPGIFVGELEK